MDRVHSVWTESTFCNTNITLRNIQWTKHGILLMVRLGSWFFLQNTMSTDSSQYFTDFQCMDWCTTDVCRKFLNNFENFLWQIFFIYCQKRDFSFNMNFCVWRQQKMYHRKPSFADALKQANIRAIGNAHSAIYDAINLSNLVMHLIRFNVAFNAVTGYYN